MKLSKCTDDNFQQSFNNKMLKTSVWYYLHNNAKISPESLEILTLAIFCIQSYTCIQRKGNQPKITKYGEI